MKEKLKSLVEGFQYSGDLKKDSIELLQKYNRFIVADHSLRVAEKAKEIAKLHGVDEDLAETAGLLHDIGGIFDYNQRIGVCEILGIDILPVEREFPLILHQKISRVMAMEMFNIDNEEVLSAIGCHTTLKGNASPLDMVLFIADKIEWDQKGQPPYLTQVTAALENSLEEASFEYIDYIMKSGLKFVHPWIEEGYIDLREGLK